MIVPFIFGGSGMALVFAPSANAVLSSVRTDQAGQASGATNAIRELGGVLGIAVLSTVFTATAATPRAIDFVNGLTPAMWVGAAVLLAGALVALVFRSTPARKPQPAPSGLRPARRRQPAVRVSAPTAA